MTEGGASVLAGAVALTGRTITGGAFDADDVTFTSVAAGDDIDAFVLFVDTGDAATSRLIAFFDDVPGMRDGFTPDGTNVTIVWNDGANKIFRI
jgi:hypothetical protein